jgi:MFS family permease
MIMNELYFIVLIVAIAVLRVGLILGGISPPLSANSSANMLLSFATVIILIYMGWYLRNLGLKRVAKTACIAMFCAFLVIGVAAFVGSNIQRPIFGIQVPSTNAFLVFLFINGLVNILLGVFFAVAVAWIAHRIKPKRRIRKKRIRKK